MQTDLPIAIREALHDSEISDDDLRYRELRSAPRQRFGNLAAAATAVACVAVVAVVVAAVNWPSSDRTSGDTHPAAAGPGFADVLGYQWRVVGLIDARGPLSVPNPHGAMIGYTRDGHVFGDDSVNATGARYRAADDGYTVSDAASTLVGYAGGEPDRARLIEAVDAMFFTVVDPADTTPPPVAVTVTLDGDTLTLVKDDVTLILARAGEQPNPETPAPTSSGTPTS